MREWGLLLGSLSSPAVASESPKSAPPYRITSGRISSCRTPSGRVSSRRTPSGRLCLCLIVSDPVWWRLPLSDRVALFADSTGPTGLTGVIGSADSTDPGDPLTPLIPLTLLLPLVR